MMNTTVKKLTLRLILSVLALFSAAMLSAQSDTAFFYYDMTFVGSGESTTVGRVKIENLSKNTSLDLAGDDVLRLTNKITTGIDDIEYRNKQQAAVYPNPSSGKATVTFPVIHSGSVRIAIINVLGQVVTQRTFVLDEGTYSASLPSLPSGTYIVSISGQGNASQNVKWISTGSGYGDRELHLSDNTDMELSIISQKITKNTQKLPGVIRRLPADEQPVLKNNAFDGVMKPLKRYEDNDANIVQMLFDKGDLLRLTATSGNCTTILMRRPTNDLEIDFRFIKCTDANGKHYPIVKIGDLFWMAEDLQAKPTGVTLAKSKSEWASPSASTPTMAYYNFDENNKDAGVYYNRAAAEVAMPEGWRLPSAGEVISLANLLKHTGDAHELLKSKDANAGWTTPSTGLDETFFRAKAHGNLQPTGDFTYFGSTSSYWAKERVNGKGQPFIIGKADVPYPDLVSTTTCDLKMGRGVRGVVDAPNAYSQILNSFEKNFSGDGDTTPVLGERFVITEEFKDAALYLPSFMTTEGIPALHKGVGQLKTSGNEAPVIISYENSILSFKRYNGTTKELDESIPLTTSTSHIPFFERYLSIAGSLIFSTNSIASNTHQEWDKHWDMQALSKDLNDDGIGDFVVCVYNKVVVVNGATFTIIAQKEYTIGSGSVLQIGLGDLLGNGKDNLVVSNGNTMEVYNDPTELANTANYSIQITNSNNMSRPSAIAIGDVIGSGSNQIVLCEKKFGFYITREIRIFGYNKGKNAFETLLTNSYDCYMGEAQMIEIVLPRLRGRGYPCDIVAGPTCFRYNNANNTLTTVPFQTLSIEGNTAEYYLGYIRKSSGQLYDVYHATNMLVGNFDKNEEGKEQVKWLANRWDLPSSPYGTIRATTTGALLLTMSYSNETSKLIISSETPAERSNTTFASSIYISSLPNIYKNYQLIGANTSGRSRVLSYKGYQLTFSEPRIHALMAAPPYYEGYNYSFDMGTSWGKSNLTGFEQENASTISGSVIVGYEQDFNLPIVGTKIGGIDFTSKIEMGTTKTTTKTETITRTNTYTLRDKNCVVLTVLPYDSYIYTIEKSYIPDEVGTDMTVSVPGKAMTMMITLDDYEWLTTNDPKVPNLRSLFKHTPGIPNTYPRNTSDIRSNAINPFVHFGQGFINIGSGGNLNRQVSVDTEMANSVSSTFNLDIELVVNVMGVKAGGGFGYGKSNTATAKVGEGHTIGGVVAGLNKVGDKPEFSWNIAWYNYTLNGQTFHVINYIVQP